MPALLRDCPAAALPSSQALSITLPSSGEGRESQHLASSWAFTGTGTGKELNSHCGSSESLVTLNRTRGSSHPAGIGDLWLLRARTRGRSGFGHLRSIEGSNSCPKEIMSCWREALRLQASF